MYNLESKGETMTKEAVMRLPTDEVFGRIVPDEETLNRICMYESHGWFLVATRSGYDKSALKLHSVLESHGEMFHYQLCGTLDGRFVPLNVYFIKDKSQ
jgi:hypothetical protein